MTYLGAPPSFGASVAAALQLSYLAVPDDGQTSTSPNGAEAGTLSPAHISPIIALAAGLLILILPRLLNYVVAIYLIIIGLIGLNGIYHFIH